MFTFVLYKLYQKTFIFFVCIRVCLYKEVKMKKEKKKLAETIIVFFFFTTNIAHTYNKCVCACTK